MSEEKTSETGNPAQAIPAPEKVPQRDWIPSLIWLVPILAAIIGISLAVKTWVQRGPEITIAFNSAERLEAGKTKVKYKDVEIGTVQSIMLSEDRSQVLVTALLKKEAKGFTAADSRFWVVRPRVAASGISGLSTLLSGAYIGADPGMSAETTDRFIGLESPPIITRDDSGTQYVLHAADLGSLDIGSPVYYRRIKVGQVAAFDLDDDGEGVTVRIFINHPYDKFVGINTRFWHASGFDMQIDAGGFTLNTQSLASVVLGGLSFQSPGNPGPPANENTAFVLAESKVEALKEADGEAEIILLDFKQSVRGLTPGAEVSFRGLQLGHVKSVGVEYDPERQEFSMPVLLEIYPARLGRKFIEARQRSKHTPQQRLQFMIDRGLRAQLRTGNFLTGQIYVALDFFPKADPVKKGVPGNLAGRDASRGLLQLPVIPSSADEIQTQVSEIAGKLSKVPFDQIGDELRQTLKVLRQTLTSAGQLTEKLNNDVAPEIIIAMKDVQETLSAAERMLSEDAPLQQDLRQTLQELTRAAASLRILTDYLERHPESLIRGKREAKQ
ncbi:MAG: MlaD family protein [Nitrosospira sp.]|nr:MlaD family protein [Nitrosospira sp.]MDN5881480.1 MlaD family protein [Nitrosospira sp.]